MRKLATYIATMLAALTATAQEVEVMTLNLTDGGTSINPVICDSTLYFASDKKNDITINYYNQYGERFYQLYQVNLRKGKVHGKAKSLMLRSNRPYNQTAIAFDADKVMHVTQNTQDKSEETIEGAPFAIYDYTSTTDKSDGVPSDVKMRFANTGYPTYSRDGKLMIFVSDIAGGQGQTDLYYCEKINGEWSEPQNMGSNINTSGQETTPFIHPSGKIFFASNGRTDSKKLDIYYTTRTENGFTDPVRYALKVNGNQNDYGFCCSDDEEWGYFTSNRHGTDKIYFYRQKFPAFEEEHELQEENYCYTFFEESAENYDPEQFGFKWTISDGHKYNGLEVDHCFDGPGDYTIELSVLDKTSGEELFTIAQYEMELTKPEQVNIHVPENIKAGQLVTFVADDKNITKFTPKTYYWDFGNGTKGRGEKGSVTFSKKGTYRVKCGTVAAENSSLKLCTWTYVTVE